MANYNWRGFQHQPWLSRFPDGVRGLSAWRQLSFLEGPPARLIEERQRTTTRPARPCVFVSHRQADVAPATRIAYLACLEGFDYWLDILDPMLSGMPGVGWGGPSAQQSSVAVAAIIEMALLNSTHVIAVMTANTQGSQWVPYEYGRVKDPLPVTPQAACWVDGAIAGSQLPEYLYLGAITRTESEIRNWLQTERQQYWGVGAGGCKWMEPVPSSI